MNKMHAATGAERQGDTQQQPDTALAIPARTAAAPAGGAKVPAATPPQPSRVTWASRRAAAPAWADNIEPF
jgi:hypothetical protein